MIMTRDGDVHDARGNGLGLLCSRGNLNCCDESIAGRCDDGVKRDAWPSRPTTGERERSEGRQGRRRDGCATRWPMAVASTASRLERGAVWPRGMKSYRYTAIRSASRRSRARDTFVRSRHCARFLCLCICVRERQALSLTDVSQTSHDRGPQLALAALGWRAALRARRSETLNTHLTRLKT